MHFAVADNIYSTALVKDTSKVALWLGANVMIEYEVEDARELLRENLGNAKANLKTTEVRQNRGTSIALLLFIYFFFIHSYYFYYYFPSFSFSLERFGVHQGADDRVRSQRCARVQLRRQEEKGGRGQVTGNRV